MYDAWCPELVCIALYSTGKKCMREFKLWLGGTGSNKLIFWRKGRLEVLSHGLRKIKRKLSERRRRGNRFEKVWSAPTFGRAIGLVLWAWWRRRRHGVFKLALETHCLCEDTTCVWRVVEHLWRWEAERVWLLTKLHDITGTIGHRLNISSTVLVLEQRKTTRIREKKINFDSTSAPADDWPSKNPKNLMSECG